MVTIILHNFTLGCSIASGKCSMKKLLFLPLFLVVSLLLAGCTAEKGPGITFIENSWAEALKQAKATHKPIFLDIYATWCGPCKKLKRETFTDKEVTDYFNTHFINVSLDGEQGDGAMLAQQFRMQSYPSLYFINENGTIVAQSSGYMDAGELMQFVRSAQKH